MVMIQEMGIEHLGRKRNLREADARVAAWADRGSSRLGVGGQVAHTTYPLTGGGSGAKLRSDAAARDALRQERRRPESSTT